ncbi:MAG: heavy metal-associated domain-containing protein [Sulfurimonas sp.]
MKSHKQTFEVLNVKCGGCASTLKKKLFDEFGEVEVDLEKEPRQISLDIADQQVPSLKKVLKKLGYPMVDEEMGFVESKTTEAKSFISCAIGKMNS